MTNTDNETGNSVQDINNTNASFIMPTPTENDVTDRQEQIEKLKLFLSNATDHWDSSKSIHRFPLPTGECISCIYWNNMFFISGTDIIRALTFRFHAFGRPVINTKKFEEGVFSDLRNLKSGKDARLEVPKSELLDLLYKFGCIRTQKKQKVFYWFSVPHDRLFLDALDRDLKREKIGIKSTTKAVAQPATSITLDTIKKIFQELKSNLSLDKRTRSTSDISRPFISDLESSLTWQNNQSQLSSTLDRPIQQKRPRVHSVPSAIDQPQSMNDATENYLKQNGYLQEQKPTSSSCLQNRHFTSFSTPVPMSSSGEAVVGYMDHSNNEMECEDYLDPISNGVNQLDISSNYIPLQCNNVVSLFSNNSNSEKVPDPDTLKKTKAMFGNLNLLGGSPNYKQRRNRTISLSMTPATSTSGGPDRIRRHEKNHLRTTTMQNSRLAMAAAKAGFVSDQLVANTNVPVSTMNRQQDSLDYYCPVDNCQRVFKRVDLLDLHISLAHTYMCPVCGRRFSHIDSLVRHGQIAHETSNLINEGNQFHNQYKEPYSYYPQILFDGLPYHRSDMHRSTSLSPSLNTDFNMTENNNISRRYAYLEPDMPTSSVSSLN